MMKKIIPIPRINNPFSRDNVIVDINGIPRYTNLGNSLIDILNAHVQRTPDAEAVAEVSGARLTYQELWSRSACFAGTLHAAGVKHGDRIAIRYDAGVNWVIAFWGIMMAGGIAVAINTRSNQSEIDFVLHDAGVKINLAADYPLVGSIPYVADDASLTDVAAIFYTSGTTGKPKGVPFTHENLLTSCENIISALRLPRSGQSDMRTLISVPLFHVTGCNTQMLVMIYMGGASVIMPKFDTNSFLVNVALEKINFLITVPTIYGLVLNAPKFKETDVSNVRWLAYGGAPITPALVKALKQAFPNASVTNGFGMTETTSIITALPDQDAYEYADSIGYAVPSVDIGISPLGDELVTGELVARGANVTGSYWGNQSATAESWSDGWYYTGDIVRFDEAGRVYLIDRKKDIIIRGGENISSVEVEATLSGAPGVIEVAVISVPDEIMGEEVGAILYCGENSVKTKDIIDYCLQKLAKFKVPKYLAFVDCPLPRSAAGKVLKSQLRTEINWEEVINR